MSDSGAFDLRESMRRGDVSSRELTQHALVRAEEFWALGAFVSIEPEVALDAADAADQRIARTPIDERKHLPSLLGLPTAHKDLVRVRGFTTTGGSLAQSHIVAEHDDPIAVAVRAAGAVCIGKTQVPEFGIAGYSENLVAAPARNPADPARTAGGSSGGTAVAIATGVITAAVASDAGGSIRIPAAACGIIGLKPGRGAVPADTLEGLLDHVGAPRMGVSGPMARTPLDAALIFDAISERSGEPATAAVRRAHELRGLRIGVSLASPFESQFPILVDSDATAALDSAIARLEHAGHTVEEAILDYGNDYPTAFTTVWTQALRRIPLPPDAEEHLGDLARWFLERACAASDEAIATSVARLRQFSTTVARQWGRFDAVLTPALAFAPPEVGEFWREGPESDYRLQCEWAPHTSMVNVVGVPAISVPIGPDAAGLPRGVQLIGRTGSEHQLLQLAQQLTA